MNRRCFTLVEIMVVVGIILIVLAMAFPFSQEMFRQAELTGTLTTIRGMSANARNASMGNHGSYGMFFFIDLRIKQQVIIFIDDAWMPRIAEETWPGLVGRHKVEALGVHEMVHSTVVTQGNQLDWDAEHFLNNDYQFVDPSYGDPNYKPGFSHRNFLVIMLDRRGQLHFRPIFIWDPDRDKNGFGDTTGLKVMDMDDNYGGMLRDIIVDDMGERLEFVTRHSVIVYSDSELIDFPEDQRQDILTEIGKPLVFDRWGRIPQQ